MIFLQQEDKQVYNWYKIETVKASALEERKAVEVTAGEKKVGIVKWDGKIHAFAATCPHASAQLCDGFMDARGSIVCPLHGYRFDVRNGRNTSGEGYKLKTYAVEIKEDDIFVGLL